MRGALLVLLLLMCGCLGAPDAAGPPERPGAATDGATQATAPASEQATSPSGPPAPASSRVELVVGYGGVEVPANASLVVLRLPFHLDADGGKGVVRTLVERAVDGVEYRNVTFSATGATALVVELEWDSATYDLDPTLGFFRGCYLVAPDGDPTCMVEGAQDHWLSEGDDGSYWAKDGALGSPDSPVRIAVGQAALAAYGCAEDCLAQADVLAKDVAVDVAGQLVVSLFYGAEAPAGYSALASAAPA